ncbi:unnamed protein product [Aphanomyces euteiches]|uniref:Uncharacterized protein n=1 Tax=Aphanomyces euteiches TaxID=100861 RepID=A0A6G0WPC9_9STRA|nr:hypothetical protein Ae201684_013184 [Aphanomyces euteiches]KAH9076398.1 hypothetical protein Ae201684P_010344 [Aphanomyces euteiches]KAH9125753.1 hypothetical protein AeMF1_003688 [Aphanomyces euteiches]KAH9189727.1 hypothetical protein AeNC1_008297 [Aphanomyces euteiches]
MVGLVGWPLGLMLSFLASIIGVLGKIMVKLSYQPKLSPQSTEARFWWGSGMVLVVLVNPVLCITAFKFAPQSLLAPMGGMCIVWNTVFSPYVLSEHLRRQDIVGAAIIFLGCVVVGGVGSHETHDIPIDELASHFTSPLFLVYITAYITLVIGLLRQAYPALLQVWDGYTAYASTYTTTCCRVSLASLAGSISGQMYCMTALLRLMHNEPKVVFSTPLVYFVAVGALTFALSGLYMMNLALKLYDALFVIYIYEATLMLGGAVSGICFFDDMKDLGMWHWVSYGFGILTILIGIFVIAHGERQPRQPYLDDLHGVKQTLL